LGEGGDKDDEMSTHMWTIYGQKRNGPRNLEKKEGEKRDSRGQD